MSKEKLKSGELLLKVTLINYTKVLLLEGRIIKKWKVTHYFYTILYDEKQQSDTEGKI